MAFILHFGPKTSCSYAPLALFCFSFLWATPSSPAISASAAALALSFCIMVWGKTFDFLAYKNSEKKKHENISLGKKKKMKAKMRNGNAQKKAGQSMGQGGKLKLQLKLKTWNVLVGDFQLQSVLAWDLPSIALNGSDKSNSTNSNSNTNTSNMQHLCLAQLAIWFDVASIMGSNWVPHAGPCRQALGAASWKLMEQLKLGRNGDTDGSICRSGSLGSSSRG